MIYDRLEIFGNSETPDTWLWCLHCERCYQLKDFRPNGELQMCHYPDCDGDSVMDGWNWETFRESHEGLPETPEVNVLYPLYPD